MSNNKFVPKWKRDKEAAEMEKQKLEKDAIKGMEFTENNFPELPKNPTQVTRKVFWEKSFVNLASDWKSESEKRSKEEDIQIITHSLKKRKMNKRKIQKLKIPNGL